MDSVRDPDISTMEHVLKRSLLPKNKLAIITEGPEGTEYRCVECPAVYPDKDKLELHLVMHNKEYRFLCGICGTGLKRKEHLDRHTLGHQEVRPHICPECGKGFKRKEHLNIHRSIHSGDKNQVCPLCHRSFYRKDHLQKHLQTHNKLFMEQNIYPLSDQELMEIKQEAMDAEDVKPVITGDFNCEITMQVDEENQSNEIGSLLEPIAAKTDKERPYACHLCEKTYKRKDHLKMHSVTHMAKDKICSECGKGFHREEQLLSHMTTHLMSQNYQSGNEGLTAPVQNFLEHTNIDILPMDNSLLIPRVSLNQSQKATDNRPHECPICQRKFKRKQHLKVHANVHMKQHQPTIWCSLCNEGFQNNFQFENHQCMMSNNANGEDNYESGYVENIQNGHIENIPHEMKKENNYLPEFIDVSEAENHSFTQLDITAVEEQNIPTPQRVYVCKFCSKPFKRKDHYKIHLHIHTGIKSFFCPDCGKGFYRKDHLQKHATVHQKVKAKPKKEMPDLFPINKVSRADTKEIKPEITITAPSNAKLRVPLQIKVPYQMVMTLDHGEQHAVTIDPQSGARMQEILS